MASIRRSGAKLLSLGNKHSELAITISQLRELRQATKAVATAQDNTIEDLIKWSSQENNRAIKDVIEKFGDICAFWLDAQKQFISELKDVRNHFEMILEGERFVDNAKALVESAETKEIKLRKDHKKLLKKSCPPSDQIKDIEDKLTKIQLDKDYAESEATIKVKDHEAVKMIRLKEALKKFSNGQLILCKKGQILFESSNDIIEYIPEITPDMTSEEIQNIKYNGSASTTQIVIRTKEKIKVFSGNQEPNRTRNQDASIASGTTSPLPSSPPAYDDAIHYQQPPVNPYYQSSPNVSYGYGDMISPNVSGLVHNSPGHIYPDISGPSRGFYDSRRNSFHGDGAAFT